MQHGEFELTWVVECPVDLSNDHLAILQDVI